MKNKLLIIITFLWIGFVKGQNYPIVIQNTSNGGPQGQYVRTATNTGAVDYGTLGLSQRLVASSAILGGTATGTNGTSTSYWYQVDLPGATTAQTAYMAAGSMFATPYCSGQYLTVAHPQIYVRTDAGTGNPTVKYAGNDVYVWNTQKFPIIDTRTVGTDIWYQIDLPNGFSQTTGWIVGYYSGAWWINTSTAPSIGMPTPFLSCNGAANSVSLSWTMPYQPSGNTNTSFTITNQTSGGTNTVSSGSNSTNNFAWTGLSSGTSYTFSINSNFGSCTSNSSTCTATPTGTSCTPPSTPSGLTAIPTSTSQINLAWNTASGATGYDVYLCNGTYLGYVSAPTTSYSHTGLSANTSYSYKISAQNGSGTCSSSQTSCVSTSTLNSSTTGSLTVNTTPSNIGGQWRVDNGTTSYNSGQTISLPAGSYSLRFKYVNYWNAPNIQNVTITSGQSTTINVSYTQNLFVLNFPLKNENPYMQLINSVMDHSGVLNSSLGLQSYDQTDQTVESYTGEIGNSLPKDLIFHSLLHGNIYAWSQSGGGVFSVNNCYRHGAGLNNNGHLLNYNGHPGIDYTTNGSDGIVYAAADGITADPIDGENCPQNCNHAFGLVVIDHGNGYKTYYYHLQSIESELRDNSGQNKSKSNVHVIKGTPIGVAGGTNALTGAATFDVHLHFEVRKYIASEGKWRHVDPYGWGGQFTGNGIDPYRTDIPYLNTNLWSPTSCCWLNHSPSLYIQTSQSILSNCSMFYKKSGNWFYEGRTDEQGEAPFIPSNTISAGDTIMFVAAGSDTLKVTLESVNIFSRKLKVPMMKSLPSTNRVMYPMLNLLSDKITTQSSAQFKISAQNWTGYDIATYSLAIDDTATYIYHPIADSIINLTLDTGYNELQIRILGTLDTVYLSKSVYYFPASIISSNTYYLTIHPGVTQAIGAKIFVNNEFVKQLDANTVSLPVINGENTIRFSKFGCEDSILTVNSPQTIYFFTKVPRPVSITDSCLLDLTIEKIQYCKNVTLKDSLLQSKISMIQYMDSFLQFGLIPKSRKFDFRHLNTIWSNIRFAAILDQSEDLSVDNVYLMKILNDSNFTKIPFEPSGNIAGYDSIVQKLTYNYINFNNGLAEKEALVIMKKQAPIIHSISTQSMFENDSLIIALSQIFSDPDSIPNDMIYTIVNDHPQGLHLNFSSSNVNIYSTSGYTGFTTVIISAQHDFITVYDTIDINLVSRTGINEIKSISDVQLYPNPSNGDFVLSFNSAKAENVHIKIFNLQGELLMEEKTVKVNGPFQKKIKLSGSLPRGIYLLQLKVGEQTIGKRFDLE